MNKICCGLLHYNILYVLMVELQSLSCRRLWVTLYWFGYFLHFKYKCGSIDRKCSNVSSFSFMLGVGYTVSLTYLQNLSIFKAKKVIAPLHNSSHSPSTRHLHLSSSILPPTRPVVTWLDCLGLLCRTAHSYSYKI